MSLLNPNASPFAAGGNMQQGGGAPNRQTYSSGNTVPMMPNDDHGGSNGASDSVNYSQVGGGGRGSYNGGPPYGGGTSYDRSYVYDIQHQSQFQGRVQRPDNRSSMVQSQFQHANSNHVMGDNGGMRGVFHASINQGYSGNMGMGMDMLPNFDPRPQHRAQHIPMPQTLPPRRGNLNSNDGMSVVQNMIPRGRTSPQAYNSGNGQRGTMPGMPPNMGSQSGLVSGNSSARPPSMPAPPSPSMIQEVVQTPSYVVKTVPRVVMVVGYKNTGKTTVAKAIASAEGFEYVNLKSPQSDDMDDSGAVVVEVPLVERLAPLLTALAAKETINGLVLDDTFTCNRFHAHYVLHYLNEAGLQLDTVVALVPPLSSLIGRGVDFSKRSDKAAHPEGFEFASALSSDSLIAIDDDLPLEELVVKVRTDVAALLKTNPPPLQLGEETFLPNCPLVTDPSLVAEILAAERAALRCETPYNFTYSEPSFVLDYVPFVQTASRLPHYLVLPWIWGDKVSLIGYGTEVYVHLASYNLLFHLQEVPPPLQELSTRLQEEADAAPPTEEAPCPVHFSLEATALDDVLHVTDMLLIGKQRGSEMMLHDRVKLLQDCFGKHSACESLRLLEHYPVSDIKTCLEAYEKTSRGAVFVNPDGIEYGHYNRRDFVYPLEANKTVRLRAWDGEPSDGVWNFDGYVRDVGSEAPATTRATGASNVRVVISDEAVEDNTINDGNIVECVLEKTTAKTKSRDKSAVFAFSRRCKWSVEPINQFFMSAFADQPQWPTPSFLDACATIAGVRPRV